MENIRARLRTRSAEPPRLSPAPQAQSIAQQQQKKRKRSTSRPTGRRSGSSNGLSIPCNPTVSSPSSAASRPPRAQSVENATFSDQTTDPADSSATPTVRHVSVNGAGAQLGDSDLPTSPPTETMVTNTSLRSTLSNSTETLVVNKDVLSEMISAEVAKRLSAQVNNCNSTNSNCLAYTNLDVNQTRSTNPLPNTQTTNPSSSALEQAVAAILDDSGERNIPLVDTMKFDLPLDSTVSDKIKKQIISREFVDLGCLLAPEFENDMKLNVSMGNNGPSLVLNNVRKAKPIYNINAWTSAMHIYGSIYLRAYPEEVGPFLQYLEFIAKMAKKVGGYWKQYDEAFRRARQFKSISWETVLVNQYMSCFAAAMHGNGPRQNGKESQFNQNSQYGFRRQQRKGDLIPRSYCFTLHREGECNKPNCRWEHTCYICKGSHSALRCKQSSNSNTSGNKSK